MVELPVLFAIICYMGIFSLFWPQESHSKFVNEEVIQNLPSSILIEFTIGFTDEGKPVITISSPQYEGLLSEAYDEKEAFDNAVDAILTYFDVPAEIAKLIEYRMEIVERPSENVVIKNFTLVHASTTAA